MEFKSNPFSFSELPKGLRDISVLSHERLDGLIGWLERIGYAGSVQESLKVAQPETCFLGLGFVNSRKPATVFSTKPETSLAVPFFKLSHQKVLMSHLVIEHLDCDFTV